MWAVSSASGFRGFFLTSHAIVAKGKEVWQITLHRGCYDLNAKTLSLIEVGFCFLMVLASIAMTEKARRPELALIGRFQRVKG